MVFTGVYKWISRSEGQTAFLPLLHVCLLCPQAGVAVLTLDSQEQVWEINSLLFLPLLCTVKPKFRSINKCNSS